MAPTTQYSPQLHGIANDPLAGVKFTLNAFGVAGFFGGDTAVNGMATVIFFLRRRWGGLYNTPGSLEIAKRYGQLASPRFFRGLFPGDTRDPSQLFGLDDKPGPKFLAACSGSLFEKTSHLGHLIASMAKQQPCEPVSESVLQAQLKTKEEPRITTPATVTVINLTHLGNCKPPKIDQPTLPYTHYGFFALIPVAASIAACVGCVLVGDWWSFSSIVLGMIANGWACFVLGLGRLTFQHPEPARDAPPGDGILWAADNAVVVIRGTEHAVNAITRGHFFLQYHDAPLFGERNSWIHLPSLSFEPLLPLRRPFLNVHHHVRQLTYMNPGRVTQWMELSPFRRQRTPPNPGDDARGTGDAPPTRTTDSETGAPPLTAGDGMALSPTLNAPSPEASPPPATPAPTSAQGVPPSAVKQGIPTTSAVHSEPRTPTPNVPVPDRMATPPPVPQVDVTNAQGNAPESRKPDSLFISISSILLTIQFVAQLLLIPQASIFGQFMFVGTLAFSWGYNVFISSIDSEEVQTRLLCDLLELKEEPDTGHNDRGETRPRRRFGVQKFEFGTWTAMAVFACLALRPIPIPKPSSTQKSTSNPASGPSHAPKSSSSLRATALPHNPASKSTPVPDPPPKSQPALESNRASRSSATPKPPGTNSPLYDGPDLSKVLDALIPNDTKT